MTKLYVRNIFLCLSPGFRFFRLTSNLIRGAIPRVTNRSLRDCMEFNRKLYKFVIRKTLETSFIIPFKS